MGLKSYIASGTPVDAQITSYLLTSIFLTQSPLHDGAVIIQSGRIVAAGCVLPLPQEEGGVSSVPRYLGMRHRAAIGISEETDAFCIAVSEETGAISAANAGKLTHGLDHAALIRILKDSFYRPEKKASPFKLRSFLRNSNKGK